MVKKYLSFVLTAFIIFACFTSFSFAETSLPEGKQTTLGLYVNAKEAYIKWLSDPGNVKIIDCRTPEEYIFVGHAPMAYNIPSKFMTYNFDENKKKPVMKENPNFVELVKEKFGTDDKIMIMCRSGGRSAKCTNKLAEAGFKNVYTIIDGFEGDTVKDPENCYNGKRLKNGWKNAGNPWTYNLESNLIYKEVAK